VVGEAIKTGVSDIHIEHTDLVLEFDTV